MSVYLSKTALCVILCLGSVVSSSWGTPPSKRDPVIFAKECLIYVNNCNLLIQQLNKVAREFANDLLTVKKCIGRTSKELGLQVETVRGKICKVQDEIKGHQNQLNRLRVIIATCEEDFDWNLTKASSASTWKREEALYRQLSQNIISLKSTVATYANALDNGLIDLFDNYDGEIDSLQKMLEDKLGREKDLEKVGLIQHRIKMKRVLPGIIAAAGRAKFCAHNTKSPENMLPEIAVSRCLICDEVFNQQENINCTLPCQHELCCVCLYKTAPSLDLGLQQGSAKCPFCRQEFSAETLVKGNTIISLAS